MKEKTKNSIFTILVLVVVILAAVWAVGKSECLCGDADGSGRIDNTDIYYMIYWIYGGGPAPVTDCWKPDTLIGHYGWGTLKQVNMEGGHRLFLIYNHVDSLIGHQFFPSVTMANMSKYYNSLMSSGTPDLAGYAYLVGKDTVVSLVWSQANDMVDFYVIESDTSQAFTVPFTVDASYTPSLAMTRVTYHSPTRGQYFRVTPQSATYQYPNSNVAKVEWVE